MELTKTLAEILKEAGRKLKGSERRKFMAKVVKGQQFPQVQAGYNDGRVFVKKSCN